VQIADNKSRWRLLAHFFQNLPEPQERAAQIKVLLMDVDGTKTDGGVTLLSQTEEVALEIKTVDARDGQGLTLAHVAGVRTGCITGRQSSALFRRAREMNMEFIYMKQASKIPAYEEVLRKAGVADSYVALCWGRSSRPSCHATRWFGCGRGKRGSGGQKTAHNVTKASTGHGAIRVTVELILKAKGIWEALIHKARA
jgi:3-deoxy-D-manno-octulosonate 8-phosphate phosphatase (KDO 8-P phosphatase)